MVDEFNSIEISFSLMKTDNRFSFSPYFGSTDYSRLYYLRIYPDVHPSTPFKLPVQLIHTLETVHNWIYSWCMMITLLISEEA